MHLLKTFYQTGNERFALYLPRHKHHFYNHIINNAVKFVIESIKRYLPTLKSLRSAIKLIKIPKNRFEHPEAILNFQTPVISSRR